MAQFAFIVVLVVCTVRFVSAVQISPKLNFDSNEQSSDFSANHSNPLMIREGSDTVSSPRDSRAVRGNVRITFGGPIFSLSQRKTPRNAPTPPKEIKKVSVVVSDEGITISGPGRIECKENVCYMTVTDVDSMGNVVNTLQLTVVSKMPKIKVDDIPVIDGIHGTASNRSPTSVSNSARGATQPQSFVYKMPQTSSIYRQTMRQNRPPKPITSTFTRNYGGWSPRIADPNPIDDKIEPPLSKTNYEDDELI